MRRWDPSWSRPLVGGALATAAVAALVVVGVQPAASAPVAEPRVDPAVTIAPVDGTLAPLATVDEPVPDAAASTTEAVSDSSVPATAATPTSSTQPVPVPVPSVSRPVRIMVVGDSTAQYTAAGLAAWAADHPDSAQVTDASVAGCGFLRTGTVPTDGAIDFQGQCDDLLDDRLPGLLADLQPDVVMLMVTMRDVEDREWDAAEGPISPFDRRFRDRLLLDYTAMADRLAAAGVRHVAWVLPPHPIAPFQGEQVKMLDPARYQVQFDVIDEVAAGVGRPGGRPRPACLAGGDGWHEGRPAPTRRTALESRGRVLGGRALSGRVAGVDRAVLIVDVRIVDCPDRRRPIVDVRIRGVVLGRTVGPVEHACRRGAAPRRTARRGAGPRSCRARPRPGSSGRGVGATPRAGRAPRRPPRRPAQRVGCGG